MSNLNSSRSEEKKVKRTTEDTHSSTCTHWQRKYHHLVDKYFYKWPSHTYY